jgi:hypothetical protein
VKYPLKPEPPLLKYLTAIIYLKAIGRIQTLQHFVKRYNYYKKESNVKG